MSRERQDVWSMLSKLTSRVRTLWFSQGTPTSSETLRRFSDMMESSTLFADEDRYRSPSYVLSWPGSLAVGESQLVERMYSRFTSTFLPATRAFSEATSSFRTFRRELSSLGMTFDESVVLEPTEYGTRLSVRFQVW